MILEKLVILARIFVSYFLQTSADFFRLWEIKPDFLLILTVYFALYKGRFAGIWVGFIGALLQDINLGGVASESSDTIKYYLGTYSISKPILGYLAARVAPNINKDGTLVIMVLIFALSLIGELMTFTVVGVFHGNIAAQAIVRKVIPVSFYNALISILWFRLLRWALPVERTSDRRL